MFIWDHFTQHVWTPNKIYYFENLQYKAKQHQLKTGYKTKILAEDEVTDPWLKQQIDLMRCSINHVNTKKPLKKLSKVPQTLLEICESIN